MKSAGTFLSRCLVSILLAFLITRLLYQFAWVDAFLATRAGDWAYLRLSAFFGVDGPEAEEDMLTDMVLVLAWLVSILLIWLISRCVAARARRAESDAPH